MAHGDWKQCIAIRRVCNWISKPCDLVPCATGRGRIWLCDKTEPAEAVKLSNDKEAIHG
jgi:hypothetical protein